MAAGYSDTPLAKKQGLERNQAPRDVIGAFMGEKVSDQMTAAAGNDPTPLFGILLEGRALKRVDLVANEAGNGHGVPSCTAMLSRFCDLSWVSRSNQSRAIRITQLGERKFQAILAVRVEGNPEDGEDFGGEQVGKTK
jgi:hypothetical protein